MPAKLAEKHRKRSQKNVEPDSEPPDATCVPLSAAMGERTFRLGSLGLATLALALGVLRLTHNDVWFDEAASFFFARQSGLNFFRVLLREDTHGPVYYGLLRLWVLAFGEGAWAGRLPSVLCAAAVVLVVAHLGATLFDRGTGLLASLFVALSPFHLYYAQEVRFYAFIELMICLHVFCFVRLLDNPPTPETISTKRPRWPWWGFVASGAASVLTFYMSGLVPIAEGVCAVWLWRHIPRKRVATAFAALAALCALWLPALVWQIQHTHGTIAWIPAKPLWRFLQQSAYTFTAVRPPTWTDKLATIAFATAAAIGIVRAIRRGSHRQRVLVCWLVLPLITILVISLHKPLHEARYLFMLLPAYFLCAAAAISRWPTRWLPVATSVLLAAGLAHADVRQYTGYKFKERWNDAAAFIREAGLPTDVLGVMPSHEAVTLRYYFPKFKHLRGAEKGTWVNGWLAPGGRLWLFTYRKDYQLQPGDLPNEALRIDSRTFGTLKVSLYVLRR